jgi:hypothetical protein
MFRAWFMEVYSDHTDGGFVAALGLGAGYVEQMDRQPGELFAPRLIREENNAPPAARTRFGTLARRRATLATLLVFASAVVLVAIALAVNVLWRRGVWDHAETEEGPACWRTLSGLSTVLALLELAPYRPGRVLGVVDVDVVV